MTIRARLRYWYLFLAVVLAGELGVSVVVSQTLKHRLESMVESSMVEYVAAHELLKTLNEIKVLVIQRAVDQRSSDAERVAANRAALEGLALQFEMALSKAEQASRLGARLADDGAEVAHEHVDAGEVGRIREDFRALLVQLGQLGGFRAWDGREPPETNFKPTGEIQSLFTTGIEPRLLAFMSHSFDEQRAHAASIAAKSRVVRNTFIASAIVMVVLLLVAMFRLAFYVGRPLGQLSTAAGKIAAGDRELRLGYSRKDEFGELAGAIDGMLDSLRQNSISRQELEGIVQSRTAELQASRESLQVTLDSMNEGVLVADLKMNVVRLNRAAERMTGWSGAEAAGRSLADVYRRVGQEKRGSKQLPVPQDGPGDGPAPVPSGAILIARDGREWPVSEQSSWIRDGEGRRAGQVIIFRDVTSERAAELAIVEMNATLERQVEERTSALQESERRHRTLLSNMPGMAYRWVPRDGGWCVDFVSDGSRAILGLEPGKLIGGALPHEQLLHPADREYVRRRFLTALEARRAYVSEYRIRHGSGGWIWVVDQGRGIWGADGELAAVEGHVSDISERKLTETALRRLSTELAECGGEEFFQRLAADLADLLGVEFGYVARVVSESPLRLRVLGYNVDGRAIPPFEYDPAGCPLASTAERRTKVVVQDAAMLYPDSRMLTEGGISGYAAMPITDTLGRVVGRFGVMSRLPLCEPERIEPLLQLFSVRVLTEFERQQAEADRQKLEAQLRQSRKMESLGTLAGGIAHDFNNILGGVIGFTELLKAEKLTSEGVDNLQRIEGATKRARDLVRQILTFSRRSEPERNPLHFEEIVAEATKLLRSTIPAMVEIRTRFPKCPTVLGDATQLHQVVVNLVTNAWHALPESGGLIEIEVAECEVSGALAHLHPRLAPGSYVRLKVADSGKGMSPQVVERIFDPFFTTKSDGKGTGLGLAVVHGIVELHRGEIVVESTEGRGTVFEVYLPAVRQKTAAPMDPDRPAAGRPVPVKGARILLVDDEAIIAMSAERLLKREGYLVTTLSAPDEALARLQVAPGDFDLLLTDLSMPGISGLELSVAARAVRPDLPIVLMTGYLDPQLSGQFQSLKINELLKKPVTGQGMLGAIARALSEKCPAGPENAPQV